MPIFHAEQLTRRIRLLREHGQVYTLRGMRRGIEKESLRVMPDGHLAQTPHPAALGAALTHPHITTDYSEALLEFVTPAYEHVTDALLFLTDTHHFTYEKLGDDMLWVNSMPCVLGGELSIPIAQYGTANVGRLKTVYRHGLWHRYGRQMQAIAGIHYNLSYPDSFWWAYGRVEQACPVELGDFIAREYFALIRNYHKYGWLLAYLFGASPAMCPSFLGGREHDLERTGKALYRPHATSLRQGDLGYSDAAQKGLSVSYNTLDEYITSIDAAVHAPHPAYAHFPAGENGVWEQLSHNRLQMEAEYYGAIRPKSIALPGERMANALRSRGVEYVEMRSLDLNPFLPVGIDHETGYFMELFATFCLLQESPPQDDAVLAANKQNMAVAVHQGRAPGARVIIDGVAAPLREWGFALCEAMLPVAQLLDEARPSSHGYTRSLACQRRKLVDPSLTPSARVLARVVDGGEGFFSFAMEQARQARDFFRAQPMSPARQDFFEDLAVESLEQQRELENTPEEPFADYVAHYLA